MCGGEGGGLCAKSVDGVSVCTCTGNVEKGWMQSQHIPPVLPSSSCAWSTDAKCEQLPSSSAMEGNNERERNA